MNNLYTKLEKEIIHDLSKIEEADQHACDACGGEDCCCCPIYIDRSRWVEPSELFEGGGF